MIDAALIQRQPDRHIAARFGLKPDSVGNHRKNHLRKSLQIAAQARDMAAADTLQARIRVMHDRAAQILRRGAKAGELGVAVAAIRAALEALKLEGEATGEIGKNGAGQVHLHLGVPMEDARAAVELKERASTLTPEAILNRAGQCLASALDAHDPDALRIVHELVRRLPSASSDSD